MQIKATAVVESSFRHVLSLDSDNSESPACPRLAHPDTRCLAVPYGDGQADLDALFESKAYKRLGVLLFPDFWKTSPMSAVWRIIGSQRVFLSWSTLTTA